MLMLILSLFFSMAVSAGVSSSICLGLTGIMAWRYRKHIQWKLILLPAICYLMTSTIAIKYSKGINTSTLSALFGGFLLLLGSYSFFFRSAVFYSRQRFLRHSMWLGGRHLLWSVQYRWTCHCPVLFTGQRKKGKLFGQYSISLFAVQHYESVYSLHKWALYRRSGPLHPYRLWRCTAGQTMWRSLC